MGNRHSALALAVSLGAVAAISDIHPATAQDAATIQAIQAQIKDLQTQLKKLQVQAAQRDAALKQAQQEATAARASAAQAQEQAQQAEKAAAAAPPPPPAAPPGSFPVYVPNYDPTKPNGTFKLGGVTVTLGGFLDLIGYYRSINENRGPLTAYNTIPFTGPTPQGDTGEFGLSAQATRVQLKVSGDVSEASHMLGYGEIDFLNGAGNSNSVESSSYTPRIRQLFSQYTYDPWQTYALAGQVWSLAAPFKKGLDPFSVWQPLTVDQSYMVGYEYLRTPALRVVKGFDNIWLGLELDTPQTIFGGSAVAPKGGAVFSTYPGGGGLNPQANYSTNVAPDVIGKTAIDTAFGHYEVFGVARWFQDQVAFDHASQNHTTFGGGFGLTGYVPIGPWADITGNFMYGYGIGRYGAGQLPDVTYNDTAALNTLREGLGTIGVVGHVIPGTVDIYAYYGLEQIGSSYFKGGGYGNPSFDNTGCFNPNAGNAKPAEVCIGNNYQLSEVTAGAWWNVLNGPYGLLKAGLQYAYIVRDGYYGKGGSPTANLNQVMFEIRYLPFGS